MNLQTNSPEFRAIIDEVRQITIREIRRELSGGGWVSVKTACQHLSVSRWTLMKMIEQGKINSKHIGKAVRVSMKSIEKFLNE